MSATRSGPRELAEDVGSQAREFAGKLRRMVITRADGGIHQVAGHLLLDGDLETRDAEVFGGIGFAARPADDEETEAIVGFVGGPGNPIIIATRGETTRISMAGDLDAGETQMHNALVLIRIKANGTVEIRTKAGTAKRLVTVDDLDELKTWIHSTMVVNATGATAGTATAPPDTTGTSVLKAE